MTHAQPLIRLPDWPAFSPAPKNEHWADFQRLARSSIDVHHAELQLLMARVQEADPALKGPDGTPLLMVLMQGWQKIWFTYVGAYADKGPLARLPNFGEASWDLQGEIQSWELPAALLIARGARPFEEDLRGVRPWDVAVQNGAAALVDQMLRHPDCPRVDGAVDWSALSVRPLPPEEGRNWSRRGQAQDASHPLQWAIQTQQEHLTRVLARAGAYDAQRTSLFSVPVHATSPSNGPELVRALVDGGASPLAVREDGLVPLEAWALDGALSPGLREAWTDAVVGHAPEEAQPRAVAAALFANATDVLPRLQNKPRGRTWLTAPCPAPEGLSWTEWAALGVLARSRQGDPGASVLQALPLKANQLSSRERAWVALASTLTPAPLHDKFGEGDPLAIHVQEAADVLQRTGLPQSGLANAVTGLLRQGRVEAGLLETAARLLATGTNAEAREGRLAALFRNDEAVATMGAQVDETGLAPLMRACARAAAHAAEDFKNATALTDALARLFERAGSSGLQEDVLTDEDWHALHRAAASASADKKPLFQAWDAWALQCALPTGRLADRRKPRM